jgi:hypothetical protein
MVRDFVVVRLRPGKDDALRDWLNSLPPGLRSAVVRRLLVLGADVIGIGAELAENRPAERPRVEPEEYGKRPQSSR